MIDYILQQHGFWLIIVKDPLSFPRKHVFVIKTFPYIQ